MRIAVMGAGAMGSVFGGYLARAGHDVTLVDVNAAHMRAVAERGLTLQAPDGSRSVVTLGATADASTVEAVDVVIVLCKSYANVDAARAIAHAVTPKTWVVTVQNGIGNAEALASVLGAERVVAGTTTVGAMWIDDGIVELSPITAAGTSITQLAGAPEVAEVLSGAGLPAEVIPNADVVVWTKLAMASTAGPLSAVLRCTVADLLSRPAAYEQLQALFHELVDVAHAEGVALDRDAVWAHALATYEAVGPHITSMAADVLAGRRTEIDAMCIEVARRGARHGVATPNHLIIGRLVQAIQGS